MVRFFAFGALLAGTCAFQHPASLAPQLRVLPVARSPAMLRRAPAVPSGTRRDSVLLRMNQIPPGGGDDFFAKSMRNFQMWSRQSGASQFYLPAFILALFLSGQFKWLFELVNFFFLMAFIIPVVGIIGVNLWVKTSVVQGTCPSCSSPATCVKGQESMCFNCGIPLIVEKGEIERKSVYSTAETTVDRSTGRTTTTKVDVVDVEAIDVDGKDV